MINKFYLQYIQIYSIVSSSVCLANTACRYMTHLKIRVIVKSKGSFQSFCVKIVIIFFFRCMLYIISILVGLGEDLSNVKCVLSISWLCGFVHWTCPGGGQILIRLRLMKSTVIESVKISNQQCNFNQLYKRM